LQNLEWEILREKRVSVLWIHMWKLGRRNCKGFRRWQCEL
jgi:hypothetical protein